MFNVSNDLETEIIVLCLGQLVILDIQIWWCPFFPLDPFFFFFFFLKYYQ